MRSLWPILLSLACNTEGSPDPIAPLADSGWAALAPDEAARALAAVGPQDRFMASFTYGEQVGGVGSLDQITARGLALDPALREPYADGASHGWAPPAEEDPAALAQGVREAVSAAGRSATEARPKRSSPGPSATHRSPERAPTTGCGSACSGHGARTSPKP